MQGPKERVRALYPYESQHSNELSFNAGDILVDVVRHDDGWWSGMVEGRLGVFPSTYVEVLEPEDQQGGEAYPEGDAPMEVYVRSNYDYNGRTGNELTIKKGDIFLVNEKDAEGKWWHGVYAGEIVRKGWFPAAYVEEMPADFDPYAQPAPQQNRQNPGGVAAPVGGGRPATIPIPKPKPVAPQLHIPQQQQQPAPQQNRVLDRDPPPMKPIKREKAAKGVTGHAEVQVISASELGDAKSSTVHIGIKDDKDKIRKVYKTATKKEADPFFMEHFQLNIIDPEESDINLSVMDGKRSLGEVNIPLRSTKRAPLEVGGGVDKNFKLTGGLGSLHLIVSYRNLNAPSKPKNFVKDESITVDTETGGYDLSQAGGAWVRKFEDAGLEVGNTRPAQRAPNCIPPRIGAGGPPPLPPRQ